jgi:hypothetical protein
MGDAKEPKIIKRQGTFSLVCRVEVNIRATNERVWKLLADAEGFPRWNTTVTRIEGQINEGETIRVSVPGTKRVFKALISDFSINKRMVWSGGLLFIFRGVRNFELHRRFDHSTDFVMEERFSGLMLPLIKGKLPDFGPIFSTYANDLKREAEKITP